VGVPQQDEDALLGRSITRIEQVRLWNDRNVRRQKRSLQLWRRHWGMAFGWR